MPHKENRKIIKVGETSFAVILPRSWFRYFNLQNGDSVEVISNSDVIIRPLDQIKMKKHSKVEVQDDIES